MEPDQPPANECATRRKRSLRKRLLPPAVPLDKPAVDSSLPKLSALERSAEALRYHLLLTEYSLSPRGRLRAYLKLILVLFLIIGLPVLFFTPVVVLFTDGLAEAAVNLAVAAKSLAQTGVAAAVLIAIILAGYCLISRR